MPREEGPWLGLSHYPVGGRLGGPQAVEGLEQSYPPLAHNDPWLVGCL